MYGRTGFTMPLQESHSKILQTDFNDHHFFEERNHVYYKMFGYNKNKYLNNTLYKHLFNTMINLKL